jgi:hypothetical protein
LLGSQAEESFCWALLSLADSGPATANTAIQKTNTTHLLQRPHGRLAILRIPLIHPSVLVTTASTTIGRDIEQVNRNPDDSDTPIP